MAKYTSDASLIKGTATAYKDWSNVPGMYKGLEDLSQAGIEMAKTAATEKEAKEKKVEDENKAAKEKKQKQEFSLTPVSNKSQNKKANGMEKTIGITKPFQNSKSS